ncbi:MAG: diaminopimelate epimerase, partial [Methanobacterium sp.]
MHGLGNDFVIIDNRESNANFSKKFIKLVSDRHIGIGCDQLIILEQSQKADVKMLIYNSDGSKASACGNATRCVAAMISQEKSIEMVKIEVSKRILECHLKKNMISVNMGKVTEYKKLNIHHHIFYHQLYVDIANPHLVLRVEDFSNLDLESIGQYFENHEDFPNKVNVNFAKINSKHEIILKTWERGVGFTYSCGSGACATVYALYKEKLVSNKVNVILPYGKLIIEILEDGAI